MMLSIDVSKNPQRIAATEIMIKESANRISPAEIEKAFLKYIKGELPIEPRDNYLTPILFSKVIKAYKESKPQPKPEPVPEMPDKEKELIVYWGCVDCFDTWKQDGEVTPGRTYIYDHLVDKGLLKNTKQEKLDSMRRAEIILKQSTYDKNLMAEYESRKNPVVVSKAKRILLEDYFEKLKKTFHNSTTNECHSFFRHIKPSYINSNTRFFSIIRNPWARVVSRYIYGKKLKILSGSFESFLNTRPDELSYTDFMWHRAVNSWYLQKDYIVNNENNDGTFVICCDILRLEHLDNEIQQYFHIKEPVHIQKRNISNTKNIPYQTFYNKKTIQIVADWYQKDIETWGFDFDTSATKNYYYEEH